MYLCLFFVVFMLIIVFMYFYLYMAHQLRAFLLKRVNFARFLSEALLRLNETRGQGLKVLCSYELSLAAPCGLSACCC